MKESISNIKFSPPESCHEFTCTASPAWKIVYIPEGMGTCYADDGKRTEIKGSEFLICSPGKAFRIMSRFPDKQGHIKVCAADISADYMKDITKRAMDALTKRDYELLNRLLSGDSFCLHINDSSDVAAYPFKAAEYEYSHLGDAGQTLMDNFLLSLLIYLIRMYEHSKDGIGSEKNKAVDELIKYIRANFGGDLSLDYLAAYSHLSPGYLSRYFKKRTGKKLSEFITETRIEKAKHKLRTCDWSVNSICEYCGYRTISNFQKAFKRSTGMTAGEYRCKMQNNSL